jgi:hypothetical protein
MAMLTKDQVNVISVEQVMVQGNLAALTPDQRVVYYNRVCESLGLNPLTKPFDYITLNGKLTLYAKRDATDQLRALRNVSVKIVSRERVAELLVVTAQASLPNGRVDESVGAVVVGTLKGEALANAMMKCETKAKRRVTLSICGLGMLDETEVTSIHEVTASQSAPHAEVKPKELLKQAATEFVYRDHEELPVCPGCGNTSMRSKWPKPGMEFYCKTCKTAVLRPVEDDTGVLPFEKQQHGGMNEGGIVSDGQ